MVIKRVPCNGGAEPIGSRICQEEEARRAVTAISLGAATAAIGAIQAGLRHIT